MHAVITPEPIDPAAVLALVGEASDGAVVLFVGIVRDHADGRAVSGMTYEAYVAMAETELHRIVEEAAAIAGSDRVAAVHRIGPLAIGEASVAIAVSSPHRDEAYRASRHVIEEIKRRLPVWKHEHYVDGATRWVEGVDPRIAAGGHGGGA